MVLAIKSLQKCDVCWFNQYVLLSGLQERPVALRVEDHITLIVLMHLFGIIINLH